MQLKMFNTVPDRWYIIPKYIKPTVSKLDSLCQWESPPHREPILVARWVVNGPNPSGLVLTGSSGTATVPGQQQLSRGSK